MTYLLLAVVITYTPGEEVMFVEAKSIPVTYHQTEADCDLAASRLTGSGKYHCYIIKGILT